MSLRRAKRSADIRRGIATFRGYFRRKMWTAGFVILIANIVMAVFAPFITPYDPVRDLQLADDLALPQWMAILPAYSSFPRNMDFKLQTKDWTIQTSGDNPDSVKVVDKGVSFDVTYRRSGIEKSGQTSVKHTFEFEYPYSTPKTFVLRVPYNVTFLTLDGVQYRQVISIERRSDGKVFDLFDTFPPWRYQNATRWGPGELIVHSRDRRVGQLAGINVLYQNVAETILSPAGKYQIVMQIFFTDQGLTGDRGEASFQFGAVRLRILGRLWGLLGTNGFGQDVWTQVVYGSRISLLFGLLVAVISISIGIVIGVIAGYKGGRVDQGLMFLADTFLQLPFIPIIILFILLFGINILLIGGLLALFSWAGLARQLRGWVLSLKERPFVEAARAIGAGDLYIMFRVIAPQTIPIIAVAFVLAVPGAILTEAGLSILGFGNPFTPSWGKLVNEAWNGGAFTNLAWWWIGPPIVAILLLAISFAFIGFTLEEVLYPRLRRR